MAKHHVLVVDDEKDIVEFLTQLLEDNGYEVTLGERRRGGDGDDPGRSRT